MSMPIYKADGKKNGLQKYRVKVNYTDPNTGKANQIERVAYGLEEAKETERRLSHEVKEVKHNNITVQQLYDEYKSVQKYKLREQTYDKVVKRLDTYVIPDFSNIQLKKLTIHNLQKWKLKIEESTKENGEPFSLDYKKNIFSDFRTMLSYAVKMEYIPTNPLSRLGNFKDANSLKKKMDFYTSDEFKSFIKVARRTASDIEQKSGSMYEWNFYVFFNIAFFEGMRKGEINALKWTDIRDNTIHITRSIAQKLKGGDRETPPKNKSSVRSLLIPAPLQKILAEHYERCKLLNGFTDDWRICGGEICLRDSTIENRNIKYAKQAGLKKIRIHDFRHSHASVLINNGINIQEIARRLGHSNVEMTWNTYSHLYPKEEERAINILNTIKDI